MQLAPLSGPSELIGSNSTSPNAMDITLGPSLQMSPAGVLSVNPSAVTVAPSTTTSLGTIQLAGVLTGTATSPQLAVGSVGASQLAPEQCYTGRSILLREQVEKHPPDPTANCGDVAVPVRTPAN